MKQLACRDIGIDCDVRFTGKTEEEIMKKASAHAVSEHNLPAILPPNIGQKCRAAITDIPDEPS